MATVDEILTRQAYADGDESWTKDDNYPSYHLYVEPGYVPVTNKRIADFNDQISVMGEQNAQFVGFQLPRYDDGLDLTVQHLYIHYQTVYGGGDGVPCNVSWSDNYVRMCWQVPAQATQEPGTIQMMIYATGTNSAGERVTWKTLPASYTIHDGLEIGGGIPGPDTSWYEQFVAQMEGKVSTAQGYANDAQASKTAAAGSATASAQSATASAQALADNKAYVESQKAAFVGYNKRETDLKYSNALIGLAADTMHVTVDDAWEAPIPGMEIAGKSEQGAEPSTDNPQEIVSTDVTAVTVTGANLFDDTTLHPGKTTVVFSDDRRQLTVTGSKSHACAYSDIPAQLIAGKNVTMSCNISNGNPDISVGFQIQIKFPDGTITYLTLKSSGSKTCSIPENITNATFTLYANDRNTDLDSKNTVVYSDVMVNIGTTPLPWEPYQPPQTASITLTKPLRGIEDVRDRITCRDGVWGVERAINQINDTGTVPISEALEVLDTPTWEPLPDETQAALNTLTTYKGRTTITVTAEGPEPDVTLEYVQDTRMVVTDLQAQINEIRNGGTT